MCEFALQYYSKSVPIYSWLIKMYSKLGLTPQGTALNENILELGCASPLTEHHLFRLKLGDMYDPHGNSVQTAKSLSPAWSR